MISQSRRLSFLSVAIAIGAAACSNPVAPTVSPSAISTQVLASSPEKHWPVSHPDGQYEHEDPTYPPEAWQCPRGYDIVYNGWNFVCVRPVCCDREFPRVGGYPDDWKP